MPTLECGLVHPDLFVRIAIISIGSGSGQWLAPVVGFGIVEFVEQGNSIANGGEATE